MNFKSLYVFTGKGGVGKSALSLGFCQYLQGQKRKTLYFNFNREAPGPKMMKALKISVLELELMESAKIYIAGKLGQTIASGIMRTPFFKSLFNVVPPLGDLITLGHLISLLEQDPTLTIVMDAPATGHVVSLFESPHTFKNIFKIGPMIQDMDRMISFIKNPDLTKTFIATLPSAMPLNEARELKNYFLDRHISCEVIINYSFSKFFESLGPKSSKQELPKYFRDRVELEVQALSLQQELGHRVVVPYFSEVKWEKLVPLISNFFQEYHRNDNALA